MTLFAALASVAGFALLCAIVGCLVGMAAERQPPKQATVAHTKPAEGKHLRAFGVIRLP